MSSVRPSNSGNHLLLALEPGQDYSLKEGHGTGIPMGINSTPISQPNIPANSSLKDQKKSYELKKKCFTKDIQSAIDGQQELHSGWLKARTAFKRWTKVWCQVKPGFLVMYTSQEAQKKYRLGAVLLSVCQLIRRPTKKEGFCFKIINPFGFSIWAKSSTRALTFSQSSLTLRVTDAMIAKLWLDALHQSNLASNLDGCQPIVDGIQNVMDNNQCNRSDISDSDDGGSSTRHLESIMLNHSNNTSNNNSNLSLDNCQAGSSKPFQNGKGPLSVSNSLRVSKSGSQNNMAFKLDESFQKAKNIVDYSKKDRSSSQIGGNKNDNNNNNNGQLNSNNFINNYVGDISKKNMSNSNYENGLDNSPQARTLSSSLNSTKMVAKFSKYTWKELQMEAVSYLGDEMEELGSAGVQSEDVHESNKNFLWHIIKQLRPGMDLSKVTLPTFILEPRSFLEKLADYYYHCDILSDAVLIDDPVQRLINIVKWYLSGFYKKPKGPKKPYNPILGERFRCFWDHPRTQSRTFFVAEQVSHHPPISAFHVSNRKDGYTITCALLSRSKFGGNSVSAILDGRAKLHLTKRNETYTLTMPYANCRGILLGSLCLELGGKVDIECKQTGCKCELDFKLAPVWASSNSYNALSGKILRSNKVIHTLDGHWDKKINIVDKFTDEKSILWEVTDSIRHSRLKRYTVATGDQGERESVKLWSKVTEALVANDQTTATVEKTRLEDMQRQEARDRKSSFLPELFVLETNEWCYRWLDNRAWNEQRDIMQFEEDFKVRTLMLSTTNAPAPGSSPPDSTTIPTFYPNIDLPLSQLSKFSSDYLEVSKDDATIRKRKTNRSSNVDQLEPSSFKSFECKMDAENMLIKQAIKQVTEKNRKLEEDLATLKRGKKAGAIVVAIVIVAILCVLFRYLT